VAGVGEVFNADATVEFKLGGGGVLIIYYVYISFLKICL
jgi:hypothetical protein